MNRQAVIEELRAGNRRFLEQRPRERTTTPASTAGGQSPFCVVLSCADSRVPVELVFDQDIGHLFVIRVAGNVASEEATASAEYAVSNLGSQVVMVLGHTACGAVSAACQSADDLESLPSDNLRRLVRRLVPSVKATADGDPASHVDRAVKHNVHHVIEELRRSPVIREIEGRGSLSFVGAVYDLQTGKVDFLDSSEPGASSA